MIPDPYSIINKYYQEYPLALEILVSHSESVATKALHIADLLAIPEEDRIFIHSASLLHDIGIFLTDAPSIGCHGQHPYICHGYLGRDLLHKEGWPKHALVCERHTGTGLTVEDIKRQGLPLPHRRMEPLSLEEQIITYADKFFSKNPEKLGVEQDLEEVRIKILKHGRDKLAIFDKWHNDFS